ncbi:MAG: hypothetical protein R3E32_21840 [Chitinophagales bacterium]
MTIFSLIGLIALLAVGVTILTGLLKKPENWLIHYLRNFLGTFFVFSGVVKAIDPTGTAIKMEDYFNVFTEHFSLFTGLWEFLISIALPLSVFMIVLEIVLGVSLILGTFKKPTLWLYIGLTLFFTVLTGFTYLTGYVPKDATFFQFAQWEGFKESNMRVTDCGCFGDFVKLKPYESFLKDVALTGLIFLMLFLSKHITLVFNKKISWILLGVLGVAAFAFSMRNVNNLPIVDFRAYKIGANLIDGRNDGIPPEVQTMYTLTKEGTGEVKKIESKEYIDSGIWKDKTWVMDNDKTEQVTIKEGKMPTIKDFMIYDDAENEVADAIVNRPGFTLFVAAYNVEKSNLEKGFVKVNQVMKEATKDNIPIIGLTASAIDYAQKFTDNIYKFYNLDAVPIKTMIRSNPGVVLIKDGIVVDKWHFNQLPNWSEIVAKHNITKQDPPQDLIQEDEEIIDEEMMEEEMEGDGDE